MSGYMVALECDNRRQIFMVREPDAEKARALVRRIQGNYQTYTLAPVSDVTLDYLRVQSNMTWHVHTHHCDEMVCCDEPE